MQNLECRELGEHGAILVLGSNLLQSGKCLLQSPLLVLHITFVALLGLLREQQLMLMSSGV